jgi:hypothetical protein
VASSRSAPAASIRSHSMVSLPLLPLSLRRASSVLLNKHTPPEDHPHPHPEDTLPFNVTHRIRELSFGPKVLSDVGPLDGIEQTMHEGTSAGLDRAGLVLTTSSSSCLWPCRR